MISIVACCHGAKLCAHAARDFRSQHNSCKSLVVELAHCERHGYSLPCSKYCFHGPDQKILTDAGRGKALIFKGEHGVPKVC